jgi:hypothetical protein
MKNTSAAITLPLWIVMIGNAESAALPKAYTCTT